MPQSDERAQQLERLVQEVMQSSKYRHISSTFISAIGKQELGKRRNFKEALKATKNKLHQVSGVYIEGHGEVTGWLTSLQAASQTGEQHALQVICREIMGHHASTRERLPILDTFYTTIFAHLPPVTSVIDIACGLHPLAIPWMGLATGTMYYAYDVQQSLTDFLQHCLPLFSIQGHAQACDVIQKCPTQAVDVAFVLKTLPCLEQIEKQAGKHLLHTLNARYLVVSFPAQSLGGRGKGMAQFYESQFFALIADTGWNAQKIEFANELVFIVDKQH